MTITAFLALVFVCVLLKFLSQGYPPTLVSPSEDNCLQRWKGGGGRRENISRLNLAGEAFPLLRTTLRVQLSLVRRASTAAPVQIFV